MDFNLYEHVLDPRPNNPIRLAFCLGFTAAISPMTPTYIWLLLSKYDLIDLSIYGTCPENRKKYAQKRQQAALYVSLAN